MKKEKKKRHLKASNGYVKHPRYGQGPNFSGVKSTDIQTDYLYFHGSAQYGRDEIIENTGIVANHKRQKFTVFPISVYMDIEKRCRDCERLFIFYAKEQLHWFEVLGFSIEADCVRCCECRKDDQNLKRLRERYNELVTQSELELSEEIELADITLTLVDEEIFRAKPLDHVRRILNAQSNFPERTKIEDRLKVTSKKANLREIEIQEHRKLAEQHRIQWQKLRNSPS